MTNSQIKIVQEYLESIEAATPGAISNQTGYVSMREAAKKILRKAPDNPSIRTYLDKQVPGWREE